MTSLFSKFAKAAAATLALTCASAAWAMPVLKSDVTVTHSIVTVSDMFDNAGTWAEEALFRAPAPGTVGDVSLEAVRMAAQRIGLSQFENQGTLSVRVARSGTLVGEGMVSNVLKEHLVRSGTLTDNMQVQLDLSTPLGTVYAANSDAPLLLEQVRYVPGVNNFSARIAVAGSNQTLNLSGRIYFTVEAPHLARDLPIDSVIGADDVVMRQISLQVADAAGVPTFDQLIGKQVTRQMREGVLIRQSDIADPIVVARNETVTLYLKAGPMTLTVRGQALNDASRGETVSVLNLVSNRVIRGIAVDPGTVEIAPQSTLVASL